MPETDPINNWLFAAMSEADQATLRSSLVRHALAQGDVIFRKGEVLELVHFPVSAQIANVMALDTGDSLAVGTVGREGIPGLAAFMADEPVAWNGVALVGGVAWSAPAEAVRSLASASYDFTTSLLRATHDSQAEMHTQAICVSAHLIRARLATWLLTLQERTGTSSINRTQEEIARQFSVRRTTIVAAMANLRQRGAICKTRRGRIVIQDRNALKEAACTCYGRR